MDYVGMSGGALAPMGFVDVDVPSNVTPAHSYQHTVAEIVQAVIDAGLVIETLREWPYANGCRIHNGLVDIGDSRFAAPPPWNLPLMVGIAATRPSPAP
jgi:hypothetical protein